ncbi:MAG: phosphatidate cytidylyltransferase [Phycisphaerae bacterium]
MFKLRLIFGLLFGAILLTMFYFDQMLAAGWPARRMSFPPGTLMALTLVAIIPLATVEMRRLLKAEGVAISMRVCVSASILCMLWPWLEQLAQMLLNNPKGASPIAVRVAWWFHTVKPHYLVPTVLALALVGAVVMYSRNQKIDGAMASAGGSLLAIVYLGVMPGFFLPIRLAHSAGMVVSILLMVKGADMGAYGFGRWLGKHKLIAWLSPGKTWEGFLGGLLAAGIIGMLLSYFSPAFDWWEGLLAGIVFGAAGQMGDLLESLLKRDAGVKDSGAVPGFGGVLDMLDSAVFAAPLAYWMLKLVHG